jgi:chromosome segregation ATPase
MITTINEFRKINEINFRKWEKENQLRQDIRDLNRQLADLYNDQEQEIPPLEDNGNETEASVTKRDWYGAELERVENELEAKEQELEQLLNPPARVARPEIELSRTLRKHLPEIQQHIAKYLPTWTEMNLSETDIAKTFKDRFGITNETPETIVAALKHLKLL